MLKDEKMILEEFVEIVNRSKRELEFIWDGKPYTFRPGSKKFVQRDIALQAIKSHCIQLDSVTGEINESFFGITGIKEFPTSKITDLDPEEVKHLEKVEGADVVFVDGKFVKKELIDLEKKKVIQ